MDFQYGCSQCYENLGLQEVEWKQGRGEITGIMSRASKITLGASITFTVGMVSYVHLWQKKERERLREGVIMDLERQQRKAENQQDMEAQAQLTSLLQQQQQPTDQNQR